MASGSVDDFTPSVQQKIRSVIASAADVTADAVTLAITAASVNIAATITVNGGVSAATATKGSLEAGIMKDQAALQSALSAGGVSVQLESAPVLAVPSAAASPTTSDGDSMTVVIAAAAGGAVVLLAVCVSVARFRRMRIKKKRTSPVATFTAGGPQPTSSEPPLAIVHGQPVPDS